MNRRDTIKLLGSAMLTSALERVAPAQTQSSPVPSSPLTCPSCSVPADISRRFSNVVDSIALAKFASLAPVLQATVRSPSSGLPIQYVDSATGNLSFSIVDLHINSIPSISAVRAYNSQVTTNSGLGIGWSLTIDDRIHVTGQSARVVSGAGHTIELNLDSSGQSYTPTDPVLARRQSIKIRPDGNLHEEGVGITREYAKHGAMHLLTKIDFGEMGAIEIARDAFHNIVSIAYPPSGSLIELHWSQDQSPVLESISDNTGRSVSYTYGDGLLTSYKDARGAEWMLVYEDQKLTRMVDPAQTVLLDVKHSNNQVASVTTVDGNTTFSYSNAGDGPQTRVSTLGLDPMTISHTKQGYVSKAVSSDGTQYLSLDYDSQGRLTSAKSDSGIAKQFAYDDQSRITRLRDGISSTTWSHDDQTNTSVVTTPHASTKDYFDAQGRVIRSASSIKRLSYVATYDKGRLVSHTSVRGTTTFAYNAHGLPNLTSDQVSGHHRNVYNRRGFLIGIHLPTGYKIAVTRNAHGQITSTTDNQNGLVTYLRDQRAALKEVRAANGDWVRASRNEFGLITELTNSRGQTRSLTYDQLNRVDTFHDATGRRFKVQHGPLQTTLVEVGSGAVVSKGQDGQDVVQTGSDAVHTYDDGWFDPLQASGLFGSLDDDGSLRVLSPGSSVGILPPRMRDSRSTTSVSPALFTRRGSQARLLRSSFSTAQYDPSNPAHLERVFCSDACAECMSTGYDVAISQYSACVDTAESAWRNGIAACTLGSLACGPYAAACFLACAAVVEYNYHGNVVSCNNVRTAALNQVIYNCNGPCHR